MSDTYGQKSTESFATYDPSSSCWKTSQGTFPWGSDEFLETWPRAGMTLSGIAFQLPPSVRLTDVTASSSLPQEQHRWPTPTTSDAYTDKLRSTQQKENSMHSVTLAQAVQRWPTPRTQMYRNPPKNRIGQNSTNYHYNLEEAVGGKLNPTWVEWLMGFPIGWTDLKDSETQ